MAFNIQKLQNRLVYLYEHDRKIGRKKIITGKQAYFIILERRRNEFRRRMSKVLDKIQIEWRKHQQAIVNARPKLTSPQTQ